MYKTSHYNVYVPIEETNNYLIYNTITGALTELNWEEGQLIESWDKLSKINGELISSHKDYISKLHKASFLVDENANEIEDAHQFYLKRRKKQYYNNVPNIGLTIAPTLSCNMACNYCYSLNKKLEPMTKENIEAIKSTIEKVINKGQFKQQEDTKEVIPGSKSLFVTWIGGEPTLEKAIFIDLSEHFIKVTSENNLKYSSQVITNGILLDEEWIELLKKYKVERVQVTIDGGRESHNKSRPLRYSKNNSENYDRILKNILLIPDDIHLTIRINSDKNVFKNIEPLFNDLEDRGIWPQRAKNINLGIAPKRTFDIIGNCLGETDDTSAFFKDYNDFYNYVDIFKDLKLNHYNKWAEKNGKPKVKKKWIFPRFWLDDCALSVSPYGLAFSADGFVYKCWEHLDKTEYRVQSVYEELDVNSEKHKDWQSYDRFNTFNKCKKCKFILRCHVVYCAQNKFKTEEPPCSEIKANFKGFLKTQYLKSIDTTENMESVDEYLKRCEAKPDVR
jgi:uncharacterized protein